MLEVLQFQFMQQALLGGLIISLATSLIGVFLVLKRMSLIGDSFAHASFTGIAIGFFLGINPILSALVFILIISLIMNKLISKIKLYSESAIAIMLSFSLALALILISLANEFNTSLFTYLFGSLLTISLLDIGITTIVLLLILLFYYFNYTRLMYSAFNIEIAQIRDSKTQLTDKVFTILCAMTIVISIKAVGILLISALLVLPALVGLRLANSFKSSIIISVFTSLIGVYLGIFLSYFFNLPVGGVIVMSLVGLFLMSLLIRK